MLCQNGFKTDDKGCSICECDDSSCVLGSRKRQDCNTCTCIAGEEGGANAWACTEMGCPSDPTLAPPPSKEVCKLSFDEALGWFADASAPAIAGVCSEELAQMAPKAAELSLDELQRDIVGAIGRIKCSPACTKSLEKASRACDTFKLTYQDMGYEFSANDILRVAFQVCGLEFDDLANAATGLQGMSAVALACAAAPLFV